MDKMVLLQPDGIVYVSDNSGRDVSFSTLHEFIDTLSKLKIESDPELLSERWFNYEPDRNLYIRSSRPNQSLEIPDPTLETVIHCLEDLAIAKDPYYGMTLQQAKEYAKQTVVKLGYFTTISSGYTDIQTGITWDCDDKAVYDIFATLNQIQLTEEQSIDFIDHNNLKHTVSFEQLKSIGLMIGEWRKRLKYHKNSLYERIDACQTIDQIREIHWEPPKQQ